MPSAVTRGPAGPRSSARTSPACRSTAHSAARTAAMSGRVRGTPLLATSVSRPPPRLPDVVHGVSARTRAPRGTETRTRSTLNRSRPSGDQRRCPVQAAPSGHPGTRPPTSDPRARWSDVVQADGLVPDQLPPASADLAADLPSGDAERVELGRDTTPPCPCASRHGSSHRGIVVRQRLAHARHLPDPSQAPRGQNMRLWTTGYGPARCGRILVRRAGATSYGRSRRSPRPYDVRTLPARMEHMEYIEVARAESERGELVLRERRDAGEPDGAGAPGQRRLRDGHPGDQHRAGAGGRRAGAARRPARTCSSAGWGSGYTMHRVLADSRVERCSVVEIEQALVDWMRDGTIHHGPGLLADERANVVVADIAVAVPGGGRGHLRPRAARRRQRPGVPRARVQRRAVPAGLPRPRCAGCCARAASSSSGPPTARPTSRRRWRRSSATPRPGRTTCVCRSGTSSTGCTSRGYRPPHERRLPHRARLPRRGPGARVRPAGGPRPSGRWRTSRSAAPASSPTTCTRSPGSRRPRRRSTASSSVIGKEQADGDRAGRRARWSPATTTTTSRSTSSRPAPAPAPT